MLRDLDITTEQVTPRRSLSVAPVSQAVRNRAGNAGIGFLAALVDVNAAMVALIAGQPDWTATANLTLHGTGRLMEGPAVVDCRLLRAGSGTVVVSADVLDGCGVTSLDEVATENQGDRDLPGQRENGLVACGLVTFSRIPAAASRSAGSFDPNQMVGQRRRMEPLIPPPSDALTDRIGLRVIDGPGGVVALDNSEYVTNSFGTFNGGALGVVFQGAAEAAVPSSVATDLQIHYLAQSKSGTLSTLTTVLRRQAGHAVCAVQALDAGARDRILAAGTVTLQESPNLAS